MNARLLWAALAAAGVSSGAWAQDHSSYVSLSAGALFPDDSDSSGFFTADFTTPSGLTADAGSFVGWTTELDTGFAVAGAIGAATAKGWRGELELAFAAADVDEHVDALIAGGPLAPADASLFAADDGSIKTTYLMLNAYYDFGAGQWPLTPYVGGGVGIGLVDVEYSPQAAGLVDDEVTAFAYQLIGGVAYTLSEQIDLFAQGRWRADDARGMKAPPTGVPLKVDVENGGFTLEAGVRLSF